MLEAKSTGCSDDALQRSVEGMAKGRFQDCLQIFRLAGTLQRGKFGPRFVELSFQTSLWE